MTEKIYALVKSLLEKSRSQGVPWEEPGGVYGALYDLFVRVALPKSSISIMKLKNTDSVQLSIQNEDGNTVVNEALAPYEHGYRELSEILQIAINQSRKVDATFDDIEAFLQGRVKKPK